MENFNFLFFFANHYNTHIVLYRQALSHNFFDFFLDHALRQRRPLVEKLLTALSAVAALSAGTLTKNVHIF